MSGKRRVHRPPATAVPGQRRRRPVSTPLDRLKLKIAAELGLADKVGREGWCMLTAAESGRLGGILGRRLREQGLAIGPRGTLIRRGTG